MDVRGILEARFGQHTKLVHALAREIALMSEEGRSRRVPVLVLVEPSGTFEVYASKHATVEVVHLPQGKWNGKARDMLDRWIEMSIPRAHKSIYLPSRLANSGNPRCCPTVDKLIETEATLQALAALRELE